MASLDEIFDAWAVDAKIDRTALDAAALDITKLHHKYLQMMSSERLRLKKMEGEFITMVDTKRMWLSGDLTKAELDDKGWNPYLKSRPLKHEMADIIRADSEVIDRTLRVDLQREKVEVLESILKMISNRSFALSNAINFLKYTTGA
jgi:hypothetical protein